MYSTELIRKFPENPDRPILYVVYNKDHILDAEAFIGMIHGKDYLDEHVTVVPLLYNSEDPDHRHDYTKYDVYMDPTIYKFMNSWNN